MAIPPALNEIHLDDDRQRWSLERLRTPFGLSSSRARCGPLVAYFGSLGDPSPPRR